MDAARPVGDVMWPVLTMTAAVVALAGVRRPVRDRRSVRDRGSRRLGDRGAARPPWSSMLAQADRRRATTLPDALDSMCRFLRAGHSVPTALASAAGECHGPIAEQWRALVDSVAEGTDLGEAVRAWGADPSRAGNHARVGNGGRRGNRARHSIRATPHERAGASRSDEALAAAAIAIGVSFGGPRAEAIEVVAQTLRERASLEQQLRGFAAQARLSAAVISLAPLGFTSITVAGDRASREVMLRSTAGQICLVMGVTLDALGWWWMGRITAHAAGPTT